MKTVLFCKMMKLSSKVKKEKKVVKPRSLLDQVESCDRGGQYELDIASLGMTVWPQETVLVSNIRILRAEKNKLVSMPCLDHFRALSELNLSRNCLTDVGELRFGAIVGLRKIDLSKNCLTSLPSDITRLTLLETLLLRENKLKALPDGMEALRSLRELDVSFNQIEVVGDVLEGLVHLDSANFTHNLTLDVDSMGPRTRRLHEKVENAHKCKCTSHYQSFFPSISFAYTVHIHCIEYQPFS